MPAERRVPTEAITAERFAQWARTLAEEHATPVVCLAVGHDEDAGRLHLCLPAGPGGGDLLTPAQLAALLDAAAAALRAGDYADVDHTAATEGTNRHERRPAAKPGRSSGGPGPWWS